MNKETLIEISMLNSKLRKKQNENNLTIEKLFAENKIITETTWKLETIIEMIEKEAKNDN